jgi:hypothetical protein
LAAAITANATVNDHLHHHYIFELFCSSIKAVSAVSSSDYHQIITLKFSGSSWHTFFSLASSGEYNFFAVNYNIFWLQT